MSELSKEWWQDQISVMAERKRLIEDCGLVPSQAKSFMLREAREHFNAVLDLDLAEPLSRTGNDT